MKRHETRFVTGGDLASGCSGRARLHHAGVSVNVFDLGHDDIDGLVGLNFLSDFNYEIRSVEQRLLVEMIAT
jgi:hypothetical protein